MGVGGIKKEPDYFREAMASPANLPEFRGNVAAVQTAPFWDAALGAIDKKNDQVRQMSWYLRTKHKNHANKDGKMSQKDQQDYIKKFRSELISPEEQLLWKQGASNAGYHYLGCAKTMALIGQAFAKTLVKMSAK